VDKKQFLKNVKEFLNDVTFRNPCKYCITKPICDNECKRLEFHVNTKVYLILGIGLIFYSIIFTIICLLI
jgi:radical SAM protein with 4Fe4S-binding SPASM domain